MKEHRNVFMRIVLMHFITDLPKNLTQLSIFAVKIFKISPTNHPDFV